MFVVVASLANIGHEITKTDQVKVKTNQVTMK
jgi:hypothetical protein